jgi:plastocyanin
MCFQYVRTAVGDRITYVYSELSRVMDRRRFLAVAGAGSAVSIAGCTSIAESIGFETGVAVSADVEMTISSFRPTELEVEAGETIEFRNTSSHTHTVTAFEEARPDGAEYFASGGYDSRQEAEGAWYDRGGGAIEPDQSFEHTFEVPGEYGYFCIPHLTADMIGTIQVR